MEPLTFDYTSYSDSSTPRTPSPTTAPDMQFHHNDYTKHDIDHSHIFTSQEDDNAVVVPANDQYSYSSYNSNRNGSLLHELYDENLPEPSPNYQHADNWQQQQQQRPHEYSMIRRATFPYVRGDRENGMSMQQYPPFMSQQQQQMMHHDNGMYPSRGEQLYNGNEQGYSQYDEFDDGSAGTANIKLEEGIGAQPVMVPSQQTFYRQQQHHHHHNSHPHSHMMQQQHISLTHPHSHHHHHGHLPMGPAGPNGLSGAYMSPHTGLPVQHTDDAASKETQYLRRRCFNCHTTEPPSWRRSTLNPGKIVCNKCGLYERTHLRPRPLRFDELRAGNKARKASNATATAAAAGIGAGNGVNGKLSPNLSVSPKQSKLIKKEPREYSATGGIMRRSSVSSASSVHSGSGASDWDDNVSIYSSGSAPPTSYNSPIQHTYPLSRSDSSSPPTTLPPLSTSSSLSPNSGIRLPNNPLSDIMQQQQQQSPELSSLHPTPRKSHTTPAAYFAPILSSSNSTNGSVSGSPAMSNKGLETTSPSLLNAQLDAGSLSGSPLLPALSVGSS